MLTLKALTIEQREQFERDGYLVVRGLLSESEIAAVKERLAFYIREGLRMLREGQKPEADTSRLSNGVLIQLEPLVAKGEYMPDDPLYAVRKVWNLFGRDEVLTQLATNPHLLGHCGRLAGHFRHFVLCRQSPAQAAQDWRGETLAPRPALLPL